MPSTLPAPDAEAVQHSAFLTETIRREIAARGGWISFERYMEMALYTPGQGYYMAGAHKFGVAGDFITAPELSPLFGRTLARQVVEIIASSSPHILELGAGSGKMAADMLAEMEKLGRLPDSYAILEVSAELRVRQQTLIGERLPHLLDRVYWVEVLPKKFSGAIIANEVLDALPTHLVHWRDSAITERGVAWGEDGFIWQGRDISDSALLQAVQKINVPDDYLSEICTSARGLVNSLALLLDQGTLLFIDYGFGAREFYHPQRSKGTLMCHYRHLAHDDPFFMPGLQDITGHVNFSDIAEFGIDAGLDLIGYTNQAFFLINCGITELLQNTSTENMRDYLPLSSQLQKLTSPAEMGELIKVIAMGKKLVPSPGENSIHLRGFASGDLTRLL